MYVGGRAGEGGLLGRTETAPLCRRGAPAITQAKDGHSYACQAAGREALAQQKAPETLHIGGHLALPRGRGDKDHSRLRRQGGYFEREGIGGHNSWRVPAPKRLPCNALRHILCRERLESKRQQQKQLGHLQCTPHACLCIARLRAKENQKWCIGSFNIHLVSAKSVAWPPAVPSPTTSDDASNDGWRPQLQEKRSALEQCCWFYALKVKPPSA